MFEFCDTCGSILVPSKKKEKDVLVCKLCNNVIPLNKDLRNSYVYSEEIEHPESEEFKNLKKMRNWQE
jgi:DNA-directed RNA polymerase subunit M/transcription elongation factor TFIIS